MTRLPVNLAANPLIAARLKASPELQNELGQLQTTLDRALGGNLSSAEAAKVFLDKAQQLAVGAHAADVLDIVRASTTQIAASMPGEGAFWLEGQHELGRMSQGFSLGNAPPAPLKETAYAALQHLNPAVPAEVQTKTLAAVLDAVSAQTAQGRVGVVQIDVDLTSQQPIARTVAALKVVGQRFDIPELKDPLNRLPVLPGYTTAGFEAFLAETGLREKYPHVDWGDMSVDGAKAENPNGGLYNHFRHEYWYGETPASAHVAKDALTPGLVEFVAEVEKRGGKVVFNSGRDDDMAEGTRKAYANGGLPNAELFIGKLPGKTDAEVKVERQKLFEDRGWVTVAVIDDREKNRSAVVNELGGNVLSISAATPGFVATSDVATTAARISTFVANPADAAKKAAMHEVVSEFVRSGVTVSLEYGSNAGLAANELKRQQDGGLLSGVAVLPAHVSVGETAFKAGLATLGTNSTNRPSVTVGGADQVLLLPGEDGAQRAVLLKGFGPAFPEERRHAEAAKRYVVMVDPGKLVTKLSKPVPVAVKPADLEAVAAWARKELGAEPVLRKVKDSEQPVVMSDGTQMLDLKFPNGVEQPVELAAKLSGNARVQGHGLFVDVADTLFVADPDQGVRRLELG